MTRSSDPLAGIDRLLVDGTNLLHALRRTGGSPSRVGSVFPASPAPAAAAIGRLRGAIPAAVGIELAFDGAPEPGMRGTRIASGLIVRHSGRRTADDLLLALVDEARAADRAVNRGLGAADNLLVVTDDRELRLALRGRGVRTAGNQWLIGRMERGRLAAPSTGNRVPAAGSTHRADRPEADDAHRGWRPGRGATTKRGNPRRRPRGTRPGSST